MKFTKLLNATIIFILINICTTSQLQPDTLQPKTITTGEEPTVSVTTENFHRKQRQSRCIRCYEEGQQNTESDPRYGNRYSDEGGRSYNRNRYYSSYPSRRGNTDDTNNWYNPNERYDRTDERLRYNENRYPDRHSNRFTERDRYIPTDRYSDRYPSTSGIRNDDRYHSRTYEHYDSRPPIYQNRYESRPELYNSRGYDQGQEYRPRLNERDRPYDRVRPGSYYNERNYDYEQQSYDRYNNNRDYDYDYRNHRPAIDDTYRRPPLDDTYRDQDNHPGRGGYANNDLPPRSYNNYPNTPPSRNQYLPNPQSPPRPLQSQNSSLNSNHDSASPDYHNNRPQPDKNSNNNDYAGDWNYSNDRNKPAYNTDKDKDIHSSPYGGSRSRPLGGSYLLDRKSNIPMDLQNKNGLNNTDDKNVNTEQSQNDNDKKNDDKSNKNK